MNSTHTTVPIEVRQIDPHREAAHWLAVPHTVHAGDGNWIAPLNAVEKQRISKRSNPFFGFGEAAFFVAFRDGAPVGRISAQLNSSYLERYPDRTGHFGFFECVDDQKVADVLLEQAAAWLSRRGMARMEGPYSLSINEEPGLLVSGFDQPPAILAGHAASWAGEQLEAAGLVKEIDLYAYRMRPQSTPAPIERLSKLAQESASVRLRHFDMKNYEAEVALLFDIFNDAWSENWGFVPFSDAEIAHMARETKPFMQEKFTWITEIDGEAAAMMVVLPDLNRVIAPFNGRLLPFNWAKLLYEIKRDRWKTARVPLLGIRKAYQSSLLGPAVLSLMIGDIIKLGKQYDLDWIEFSWVLETNRAMVRIAETAAGGPCKTYRLYSKAL